MMNPLRLLRNALLSLAALTAPMPLAAGAAETGLPPHDPRCEYLTDPLGIDVAIPRFSWKQTDPDPVRGQKQTAYRILVAGSKDLLAQDTGDLWDSGVVSSSQSVLVPYGGKKLRSNQDCYWKVRIHDKDGAPSAWSAPARFSMGLLEPGDWQGPWIHHPDAPVEEHIWFRKNFALDASPDSAFLHVASLGYHEVFVNGQAVAPGEFGPALTRIDKRVLYRTYDVRHLLKTGDNVIAIWQGPGWTRYKYFQTRPALRVQLNAKTADGQAISLPSDATWRCQISSSANTGKVKGHDNGGERIDARQYLPDWNAVGFDDSAWKPAKETKIDVELSAHMVEPARFIETIPAKSITTEGPVTKVDMGKNFTGFLEIKLRGLSSGDEVVIQANDDTNTPQDSGQKCVFIGKGGGEEVFRNRFNFIAGRYLTLTGLKTAPLPGDITGLALSTDVKRTGRFTSSSELFNRIYETDLWTWRANLLEGFTMDCPHRERLGYGEIAAAVSWGIALPNYESGALWTKQVRDWSDVQEESGRIPYIAPQINDFSFGGPMWSSAGLNVAWNLYQHYGDERILALNYPSSRRWLEFLHRNSADGLLQRYDQHPGRFLGDWAAPGPRNERGNLPQALFFNNCVYAMNLRHFIEMARILGKPDDMALYGKRLADLTKNIHATWFDPKKKRYMNGTHVQYAFALLTGIPPEKVRPDVLAKFQSELENKNYLDVGSSGLPVLYQQLIEGDTGSGILYRHLSKTDEPSYGYFLARGENTWPEFWNVDVPSRIHTCFTGVSSWFTKGVCGVRPDPAAPGFQSFLIQPVIGGDLTFAEFTTESPYGFIRSRWERSGDDLKLSITVPPNSQATVHLPTTRPDSVTEGGKPVANAEGVTPLKPANGHAVMKVSAGRYEFSCRIK
jgi:alpha-L-rhamnosidase